MERKKKVEEGYRGGGEVKARWRVGGKSERGDGGASGCNSLVTFGGYVCISIGLVWVVVVIIF